MNFDEKRLGIEHVLHDHIRRDQRERCRSQRKCRRDDPVLNGFVTAEAREIGIGADHEARAANESFLSLDPRFENLVSASDVEPARVFVNVAIEDLSVRRLRRPQARGEAFFERPVRLFQLAVHCLNQTTEPTPVEVGLVVTHYQLP